MRRHLSTVCVQGGYLVCKCTVIQIQQSNMKHARWPCGQGCRTQPRPVREKAGCQMHDDVDTRSTLSSLALLGCCIYPCSLLVLRAGTISVWGPHLQCTLNHLSGFPAGVSELIVGPVLATLPVLGLVGASLLHVKTNCQTFL
jgi:hypothetical protein